MKISEIRLHTRLLSIYQNIICNCIWFFHFAVCTYILVNQASTKSSKNKKKRGFDYNSSVCMAVICYSDSIRRIYSEHLPLSWTIIHAEFSEVILSNKWIFHIRTWFWSFSLFFYIQTERRTGLLRLRGKPYRGYNKRSNSAMNCKILNTTIVNCVNCALKAKWA